MVEEKRKTGRRRIMSRRMKIRKKKKRERMEWSCRRRADKRRKLGGPR